MENFYKSDAKKYLKKTHNPGYTKKHFIEIPFRILVVGPSGSGKTNSLMNLLRRFNDTFNHIYLCVKNADEPLYKMLIDKLGDFITVYENGEVPELSTIPKNGSQLIIFDDLVGDKKANNVIEEYFKMARKKGISSIYLSQSYFKTPKFIRDQLNYLIIKKINSNRDLRLILTEYPLDVEIDDLKKIYNQSTQNMDILLIDLLNSKLFHNFTNLIN